MRRSLSISSDNTDTQMDTSIEYSYTFNPSKNKQMPFYASHQS